MREMRSEVNAYASTILVKMLGIVNDLPGGRRHEVQGIEREIHQMLAFIDPYLAAELDAQPPVSAADDDPASTEPFGILQSATRIDERIDAVIGQLQQADLHTETTIELLRDLRASLFALRDDLRQRHESTTEALQSLISTTRSLHYTITALSARSEQIADVTGIAEEQVRVGVWKYALIAGLSSGAIVAAIVAFINLAT